MSVGTQAQTQADNRGAWMVLAAAMLWGTTGTAQAFAPTGATPLAVGAIRLAVGGTALLLLALVRRKLRWHGWPWHAVVVAIAGIAFYQVSFFAGVARTGVAVGTVVGIGSAPIFAGLLGLLLLGERPTRRWLAATALAVAGCTLLVTTGGDIKVDSLGVIMALGAGASYALYTMASRDLLRVQPPDAVAAVTFFGGALILAPLLLFVDLSWLAQPRGIMVALELGLLATTLSYVLYMRGLVTVPAATAVTLALMEPLTAAVLGLVVLGERLTPLAMVGVGLMAGGLAVLALGRSGPEAGASMAEPVTQ